MKAHWIILVAAAAMASVPAAASDSKPTAKEVAAARGDCARHRRSAEKLEADSRADPATVAKEQSAWEHACARAEALMEAAGMEKPSAPPHPAPPPQQIIIEDRPTHPDKPIIIDEPSAPPTTDSAPIPPSPPTPPTPPPP